MAVRHYCDRCDKPITVAVGMTLTVDDTTRGTNGEWELCDSCAQRFVWWLEEPKREVADAG